MTNIEMLMNLFSGKKTKPVPLLIIRQEIKDTNVKEYLSIDEAIADLEKDPNVSSAKIENLKSSLKQLRNKSSIKIRNGEIVL